MRTGRPRTIIVDEAFCDKIVKIMSRGCGLAQVGKELGCTPERIGQLAKENKDLFRALEQGKALSQAWWEEKGRTNLKDKKFNVGLYTLFMSNKFGWHQKQKVETESKNETVVKFSDDVINSVVDKLLDNA